MRRGAPDSQAKQNGSKTVFNYDVDDRSGATVSREERNRVRNREANARFRQRRQVTFIHIQQGIAATG